jgi:hypothetical protein
MRSIIAKDTRWPSGNKDGETLAIQAFGARMAAQSTGHSDRPASRSRAGQRAARERPMRRAT